MNVFNRTERDAEFDTLGRRSLEVRIKHPSIKPSKASGLRRLLRIRSAR